MTESLDPLNAMRQEMGELHQSVRPRPAASARPPGGGSIGGAGPRRAGTRPPTASVGSAARRGRPRPERLSDGERLVLAGAAVLSGVGAALNPVVLHAVTGGSDWWQRWSATALAWPAALVQPLLLGAASTGLLVLAIATAGFTEVRSWQYGVLIGAVVAVAVGLLPWLGILLGFLIAGIVILALVAFVVWALLMMVSG